MQALGFDVAMHSNCRALKRQFARHMCCSTASLCFGVLQAHLDERRSQQAEYDGVARRQEEAQKVSAFEVKSQACTIARAHLNSDVIVRRDVRRRRKWVLVRMSCVQACTPKLSCDQVFHGVTRRQEEAQEVSACVLAALPAKCSA